MLRTMTILLSLVFMMPMTVTAQDQIVKLGLSDLLFSTINLEYERALTSKTTFLVETGFQLNTNIPDLVIETSVEPGNEENITATTAQYNSFNLAASYRIYTKGEPFRGFYFGPYLRYSNYDLDIQGRYDNNAINKTNIPASIVGDLSVFSIGGEIGYQWLINDKVAIGWNIIGLGASFNNIDVGFTADDEDVFQEWERDVQEFLDDLPSDAGDNFSLTSDNATRTIDASANFPFISFRASLSIGYAF